MTSPATVSNSTRMEPSVAWTVVTDAPLRGLSLMREALRIVAWDEADILTVLDPGGDRLYAGRSPGSIRLGIASDDGSTIAIVGESRRLWLLGPKLDLLVDRETLHDPIALGVDPFGRYVAVSSKSGTVEIYTRYGRKVAEFETPQPAAHLCFVPSAPVLIGAAGHGSLFGYVLEAGGRGRLFADRSWRESLLSNIGQLTVTGDGSTILASCFIHGIQRFNVQGRSEGAYHLGSTASLATPDFIGRSIAAATQEGELFLLNRSGNVRWKTGLTRPAISLELDALGRWLVFGQATGEITRIDLEESARQETARTKAQHRREPNRSTGAQANATGPIRSPLWTIPLVESEEQAETTILEVLEHPSRIALMTSSDRLELVETSGRKLGKTDPLRGVGRTLKSGDGWIVAATDRDLLVFDAQRNGARKLEDLFLVQLTHLEIDPLSVGLAIVQERDRVGRATIAGRWVWRQELDSGVEDLAIVPGGMIAVTTDDGRVLLFDPAGKMVGVTKEYGEPLSMVAAPEGSPAPVGLITLARQSQMIRGHDSSGSVIWEATVPRVTWQLHRVGRAVVATTAEGHSFVFDGHGRSLGGGRETAEPTALFSPGPDGRVLRAYRRGPHIICDDPGGKVRWRSLVDNPRGPIALSSTGLAAINGKELSWYPHQ